MTAERLPCLNCGDTGWVREDHTDRPWEGQNACGCGGAGAPCPFCNPCGGPDGPPDISRSGFDKTGHPALGAHGCLIDVDAYGEHVPVPAFRPRMVCTVCGIIGADVRPNWAERATRPSLTG